MENLIYFLDDIYIYIYIDTWDKEEHLCLESGTLIHTKATLEIVRIT